MALIDDLTTARDNLAAELAAETTARLAAQAAGRGVKTSYSANGRSVDWPGYLASMTERIKDLTTQVADLASQEEPWEEAVRGYT